MRTQGEIIDRHHPVELYADCQSSHHPDSTGLAFPTEFLSRRSNWRQDAANAPPANGWLFGPHGSEPVVEKLYRLLASQFPSGKPPKLELMSWIVNVSPTTLKRQLRAAGTSYTGLLDRIRFDTACDLLATPQVTIREIAYELGYSGTNNFVRSFRRMTGMTPGAYRLQTNHIESFT